MARHTAKTAVVRATRRLNALSRRSSSSSGFGSSTSATRRRVALADLVLHRVLAGLERRHEALRLLLEHLTALVEPVAGAALRVVGHLLGPPRELAAALEQLVADLAPGLWREHQRGGGTEDPAEEEPAQVTRRIVSVICHGDLLDSSRSGTRKRRAPS